MKLFSVVSFLVGTVAFALGQRIRIGAPADNSVLHRGQNFTAQIIEPAPGDCIQVGIALAIAHCNKGVCPQPLESLGDVLYAGPWDPIPHDDGCYYQNFTLHLAEHQAIGPSLFSLTHVCLYGAGPFPVLQIQNNTVTVE